MNKNSKIYISGHNGMLGSALVRRLKSDGYSNIINRTQEELDLTRQSDVDFFFAKERPEYVFHIAARIGGIKDVQEHLVDFLGEGVLIALNVLYAAHEYEAKGVVYVSSAKGYPECAKQPMSEDLFMSGKLDFSWLPYGLPKALGAIFCDYVHRQFGKHFLSVILPSLYGPGNYGTTVIPMLVDRFADAVLTDKDTVSIWGTGKAYREFLHSDDAADALLFLMKNGKSGEYYNVGSSEEQTIKELAYMLKEISGFNGKLIFDTTKPESSKRQILDSRRIFDLGWTPKISFRKGIEQVYWEHYEWIKMYMDGGGVKYSRKLLFSWHSALQFQRGAV